MNKLTLFKMRRILNKPLCNFVFYRLIRNGMYWEMITTTQKVKDESLTFVINHSKSYQDKLQNSLSYGPSYNTLIFYVNTFCHLFFVPWYDYLLGFFPICAPPPLNKNIALCMQWSIQGRGGGVWGRGIPGKSSESLHVKSV